MACNPTPTATLFDVTTSSSLSTSTSESISSLPSIVTTIQSTTCVATSTGTDNQTTCISTSTINEVSTIPGGQTTIEAPIVATIPVVKSVPTQTLFASCGGGGSSPTPPPSPPPPLPPPSPSQSRTLTVVTTPPPATRTSRVTTTLSNGSVVATTVVVTSTSSTTSVYSATSSFQQVQGIGSGRNTAKLAPIIGGIVGGLFVLLTIIWLIMRRRGSWDDIFEQDEDGPTNFRASRIMRDPTVPLDMTPEIEPKPYQYGLVGPNLNPPSASPPGSPPHHPRYAGPDSGQGSSPNHNRNLSYTSDYSQNTRQYSLDHIETQHNRRPSATSLLYTPLILPNTGVSPDTSVASGELSNGSASRPLTGNFRPSTDGSGVSNMGSVQMQQVKGAKSSGTPGEFGAEHDATDKGNVPTSRKTGSDPPQMLSLTNWNPSTDAISVVGPSREQPHGHASRSPVSSADQRRNLSGTPRADSPPTQAGPSTSENVIMHTDGGTVRQDAPSTDVEEAPPAYEG